MLLVLGRRKKVWDDAPAGIRENDEEVVIGDDLARVYLIGTTLLGDPVWDSELGVMRGARTESVRIGLDMPTGSWLTKRSPAAEHCFSIPLRDGAKRYPVQLCLDEKLYLDHDAFGENGVMMVVTKIVHATHVRFGFAADRQLRIHRLEVYRRIQLAAAVVKTDGDPAPAPSMEESNA